MMDAVKFVKERRRMFYATGKHPKYNLFRLSISAEDVVKEVEEWSAAHPRKTRQGVFMELYPESIVGDSGVLRLCPRYISAAHRDGRGDCKEPAIKCVDCCREFWMQEVESDD